EPPGPQVRGICFGGETFVARHTQPLPPLDRVPRLQAQPLRPPLGELIPPARRGRDQHRPPPARLSAAGDRRPAWRPSRHRQPPTPRTGTLQQRPRIKNTLDPSLFPDLAEAGLTAQVGAEVE